MTAGQESVTENRPPGRRSTAAGKGEKVRQELTVPAGDGRD